MIRTKAHIPSSFIALIRSLRDRFTDGTFREGTSLAAMNMIQRRGKVIRKNRSLSIMCNQAPVSLIEDRLLASVRSDRFFLSQSSICSFSLLFAAANNGIDR